MKPTLHRVLRILAVASCFVVLNCHPAVGSQNDAKSEFVRLSYVEGDTRVSQGHGGKIDLNSAWEQALHGLPIQEGFTLATGGGRAEIEFESGWTAYLAQNSTLEFKNVDIAEGVPRTKLMLLTGTISVEYRPVPGESLDIEAPSGDMARFVITESMRIDSFLDGLSVTPGGTDGVGLLEAGMHGDFIFPGKSTVYVKGNAIPGGWHPSLSLSEWEKWVSARVTERNTILAAAMKASGLSEPVPGLVDLYKSGDFFDCEGNSKCWAPTDNAQKQNLSAAVLASREPGSQSGPTIPTAAASQQFGSKFRDRYELYTRHYPGPHCTTITETVQRDLYTREERVVNSGSDAPSWGFPLCHAGSFSYYPSRGYVWVAGKKHHHHPCHWVKYQGHEGYVPRSWRDVRGRPPVNLKYGMLIPSERIPGKLEVIKVADVGRVSSLSAPPRAFREPDVSHTVAAGRPQIEARLFSESIRDRNTTALSAPITFDFGHHAFMRQEAPTPHHASALTTVAQLNSSGGIKGNRGAWLGAGTFGSGGKSGGGGGEHGWRRGSGGGGHGSGGSGGRSAGSSGGHGLAGSGYSGGGGGGGGHSSGGGGYSGGGSSGHSSGGGGYSGSSGGGSSGGGGGGTGGRSGGGGGVGRAGR
jgi:hypothetical protein